MLFTLSLHVVLDTNQNVEHFWVLFYMIKGVR